MERGFISPSNYNNSLSVYIQNLSANPQINLIGKEARIEPFKTKQGSLGRDLDPGPLPYQGNDVRFIDLAAIKLVAVAAISPFTGGVAFAFLLYIAGIVITFVVKNTKAVGITLLVIGVIAMAITNLWGIIPFALLLPAGIVRYNPYRQ